jgi:hypothetical protein
MRVDLDDPSSTVDTSLTTLMPAGYVDRLMVEAALNRVSPDDLLGQALTEYFARLDRQRGDGTSQ